MSFARSFRLQEPGSGSGSLRDEICFPRSGSPPSELVGEVIPRPVDMKMQLKLTKSWKLALVLPFFGLFCFPRASAVLVDTLSSFVSFLGSRSHLLTLRVTVRRSCSNLILMLPSPFGLYKALTRLNSFSFSGRRLYQGPSS